MTPTKATYDQERGFTCRELVVVLVIVTLGFLLLLPALARTRTDSRAFQCLNNVRELTRAWRMWSDDNQDLLLYAAQSSPSATNRVWVTGELDFNPQNTKNWDVTASIFQSPMWTYCGTNGSLWHCPSDSSYVIVNGVRKARVRSYVMNLYLGGYSGTASGSDLQPYRLFLKSSELNDPSPAQLFVLTDVRPDHMGSEFTVNMAGYSPRNPNAYSFFQFPGANHDCAAVFSFADGRADVHRWLDPRTTPPLNPLGPPASTVDSPRNPDVAWLQDRATRPK
jgi:type II secretory pathway pseudopilin PulG